MSESNPLVQRVNALLKRHQQQVAQTHAQEQPRTLTREQSVVVDAVVHNSVDAPAAAVLPDTEDDIPLLTEIVDPAALQLTAQAIDEDALAARIERAVLQKLLAELDRTLDQRLGRTITDLLEQVLHGLRAELSVSVRQMVREAVSTAIAREIAARARPG